MARSLEPYRNPKLPDSFTRWIEVLRRRIAGIPCFTFSTGSPESAIDGQSGDLYYDKTTTTYFQKTTDTGNTGWEILHQTVTATTAELTDITDTVNTSILKRAGYQVFNSTTSKPVWSVGSADGSLWVDATGATAHTPV